MVRSGVIWVAVLLILALLMGGCTKGGSGDAPGKETKPTVSTQDPGPSETPVGYGFTSGDVTFGVGMDATKVVEKLGTPKNVEKTASCAFDNSNDIVYTYDDFKISADDHYGYERIYCIALTSDLAETDKGIYIGATAEEVTAAYGEPTEKTDAGLFYKVDGVELQFFITDGKVSDIQYYDANFL